MGQWFSHRTFGWMIPIHNPVSVLFRLPRILIGSFCLGSKQMGENSFHFL